MVYDRNGLPDEKTVIKDSPKAEYRVTYDEIGTFVSIEHASGKRVHQGLRFSDPEVVDRLIEALAEYRDRLETSEE